MLNNPLDTREAHPLRNVLVPVVASVLSTVLVTGVGYTWVFKEDLNGLVQKVETIQVNHSEHLADFTKMLGVIQEGQNLQQDMLIRVSKSSVWAAGIERDLQTLSSASSDRYTDKDAKKDQLLIVEKFSNLSVVLEGLKLRLQRVEQKIYN